MTNCKTTDLYPGNILKLSATFRTFDKMYYEIVSCDHSTLTQSFHNKFYTIKNLENSEISTKVYLHNGHWQLLDKKEKQVLFRKDKLERLIDENFTEE